MRYRPYTAAGAVVAIILALGCTNPVIDEQKTDGEWIRELLTTNADAVAVFSTGFLSDQTGTTSFSRTVDSVKRSFFDTIFFVDSSDTIGLQSPKQAIQPRIVDSVFGKLTYMVNGVPATYPYAKLLYAGKARFLKLGGTSSSENPWHLWRMESRYGGQPGLGSPIITTMSVSANGQTMNLLPRPATPRRLFRDSVFTVDANVLTAVTVTLTSATDNDSFFVTYPAFDAYQTEVMVHDSLTHTATVEIQSIHRYGVLGVQGFKRRSFQESGFGGAQASSIQSAVIRFYPGE